MTDTTNALLYTHPAPAAVTDARKVLEDLLAHVDAETCTHEETHRGGVLWTICDGCGREWADDWGGFQPHQDAPAVAAARAYIAALQNGDAKRQRSATVTDSIDKVVAEIAEWLDAVANVANRYSVDELADVLKQASGQLNALRVVPEWQDIETAPIDTDIILYGPNWLCAGVGCIGIDGIAYDPSGECLLSPSPTHWQPLPTPPAGEKE